MFLVPINYFAIVLCAVAAMVIGAIWYGPFFGNLWTKMAGITPERQAGARKDMPKTYGVMFIASLLMAYALAHFVWYAAPGSLTPLISLKTATWGWLGFVLPVGLSGYLFSSNKKPIKLLAIELGYYLVTLWAMAAIIFVLP